MKIIIIGAGISGVLAEKAFASFDPDVYDIKGKYPLFRDHTAVMRMRYGHIGLRLGCDIKKVSVRKAVYCNGEIYNTSDLQQNNMYSLKTTDSLRDTSLLNLETEERYIMNGDVSCDKVKKMRLDRFLQKGEAVLQDEKGEKKYIHYDACISTIPMRATLCACGIDRNDEDFKSNVIYNHVFKLDFPSSVYQTIYYPEPLWSIYRATIQGSELIVESLDSEFGAMEHNLIEKTFGIKLDRNGLSTHTQSIGKILPIDDKKRKDFIYQLTNEFNIYSLGRHAIWKPIRVDNLIDDIQRIKGFILSGTKYDQAKEMI